MQTTKIISYLLYAKKNLYNVELKSFFSCDVAALEYLKSLNTIKNYFF